MKIQQIEQNLKAKLLTFTTSQLIRLMVVGLRNRHTQIDMGSFGIIRSGVCFGCAATNAILEILGVEADVYIQETQENLTDVALETNKVLAALEYFFDALRMGEHCSVHAGKCLEELNKALGEEGHFQPVKYPEEFILPKLTDHFTEDELQAYEELANCQ